MKKIIYLIISITLFVGCTDGFHLNTYDSYNPSFQKANSENIVENDFIDVSEQPISTFGLDPDGASYAKTKKLIEDGIIPNPGNIRIEEFINYFNFNYPLPSGVPVHVEGEIGACPWEVKHKLLRIGIQGKDYKGYYPKSNFVFLIDVSGSMRENDELVEKSLGYLIDQLNGGDVISMVTYAGKEKVLCEGVSGSNKTKLKRHARRLKSGGSTNGEAGITKAYKLAEKYFRPKGNNRVVLITDGDFNVGINDQEELKSLIKEKARSGVYLSALGVNAYTSGQQTMQNLALRGNGTYDFIGNERDARKVFIQNYNKFFAVAKDVKIQVHFNSDEVKRYRLIGYENRLMSNEDFDNDTIDSGDLNSNQSVTAIYELEMNEENSSDDPVELHFKYKDIGYEVSKDLSVSVEDNNNSFDQSSENFRFAAGITGFGLLVKDSQYKGELTSEMVKDMVGGALTFDPYNHRSYLLEIIEKYEILKRTSGMN